MKETNLPVLYPKSEAEWRSWLEANHLKAKGVWVEMPRQDTGIPGITWKICVKQALCFGWIDSKKVKVNAQFSRQWVSPRKPKGMWSLINKNLISELEKDGLMYPAGMQVVARAKENGAWSLLDSVDALLIPADLQKRFDLVKGSEALFRTKSKSFQKLALAQLVLAKTTETREKRISALLSSILPRSK